MVNVVSIDDNTEAFGVPTGLVIMRTVHRHVQKPGGWGGTEPTSTHMLFVPCSARQRDKFLRGGDS